MTLKPCIWSLVLLFLTGGLYAQQFKLNKADNLFNDFRFAEAITLYKEVNKQYPENLRAKLQLAEAYRLLNNSAEAEKWYSAVVPLLDSVSVYKLHYAQVLMSNKKYDEAAGWLEEYLESKEDDRRAKNLLRGTGQLHLLLMDSTLYSIKKMPFNSEYSDFGPVLYQDGLMFASAHADESGENDNWSGGQPTLDLVYTIRLSDTLWTEPSALGEGINGPWHEGPAVFTDDYTKIYLTRQNYEAIGEETTVRLKLFESEKEGDAWSELEPLPFNSDQYSVGHPAFSGDGKTLYFASDMAGGYGGLDLYKSQWKDSTWSAPENLGRKINTEGDEGFPFVFQDTLLFFASNGHAGLGGLDIYSTTLKPLQEPINIGAPINSSKDDFGILLPNKNLRNGYFSSNRGDDPHDDNIYSFDLRQVWLTMRFFDRKTYQPVDSVQVRYNSSTHIAYKHEPFRVQIDTGRLYSFTIEKEGYIPFDTSFALKKLDEKAYLMFVYISQKPELLVSGTVMDTLQQQPVETAKVQLYTGGKLESELITDATGSFTFPLDEQAEYVLSAEKYGYFLLKPDTVDVTAGVQKSVIKAELNMLKMQKDVVIRLDNIYYDLDKYTLREEAALELDKLVRLLKQYPEMTIELRSHTDNRATSKYNQWLSNRRATIAVQYVISKGISPSRVSGIGFGESMPVNRCRDGVPCTEAEYQANRRTEFRIINPPNDVEVIN